MDRSYQVRLYNAAMNTTIVMVLISMPREIYAMSTMTYRAVSPIDIDQDQRPRLGRATRVVDLDDNGVTDKLEDLQDAGFVEYDREYI